MTSPETKKDQLDACGRRGGGGCSPATEAPMPIVAPYWGDGGLIIVARPSAKAFGVPGPSTKQ